MKRMLEKFLCDNGQGEGESSVWKTIQTLLPIKVLILMGKNFHKGKFWNLMHRENVTLSQSLSHQRRDHSTEEKAFSSYRKYMWKGAEIGGWKPVYVEELQKS